MASIGRGSQGSNATRVPKRETSLPRPGLLPDGGLRASFAVISMIIIIIIIIIIVVKSIIIVIYNNNNNNHDNSDTTNNI